MYKSKIIVLVIAFLVIGWGLGASDKGITIGIVDLDQAVLSTDEGKAARQELERKTREAEVEIKPMVEHFQEMMKEYQEQEAVRSEDWKRDKQLDAAELRSQIEYKQKEIQNTLEVHRERLVAPLREKLLGVVDAVGKGEGFSLIIMRNTPGVMYTRESLDITELIIKKFNEKS